MSAATQYSPLNSMKITKVKEHIGAIITGVDLARPIDAATQKRLYATAVENVVRVIRGQAHLTPAQVQAAGEALPDTLKRNIDGMKTENTLISSARFDIANPDIMKAQVASKKPPMVHPLVRTHPETGTKAVWFHKSKTETVTGMTPEETQSFLQNLTDKLTQPQFCYAHEYQKGDLLIVDDRASLHMAGHDFDPNQHRRLYRMLVRGGRPC